jgi:hypothetical protein
MEMREMSSPNPTQLVNEWLVSDPGRVELWRGAAADSLALGHMLSLEGYEPAEYALLDLAAKLRLLVGGQAPHLGASPEIEWVEVAAAIISGMEH